MAFSRGPKIITDGLVVNLDVGNLKSFKGIPTTNLLNSTGYSLGTNNTTLFKTNYGSETVSIPKIQGTRTAHYCNIYNDYNGGSGQCCLQVFSFGDITVLPNTLYTYQIIYRTTTGYNHQNYMYHYEYNSGTYITEYGLLDNSRIEDLGDGWKHAWGTFTSNASTNRFMTYFYHYEYGIQDKIQLAGVSLTQGSTIHDPSTLLPISTTRGSSSCSIDTSIKTNDGNLLNGITSLKNSNTYLVFDGVNDNITIGNASNFLYNGVASVNIWLTTNVVGVYKKIFFTGDAGTSTIRGIYFSIGGSPYNTYFGITTGSGQNSANYNVDLPINTVVNLCGTFDGVNIKLYVNGNLVATQALSGSIGTQGIGRISGYDNNNETWDGKMGLFQIYDKALTAVEVKQNYNATKSRYGL